MPDHQKLPDQPTPEIIQEAREAFMSVVDAAVPAYEIGQLGLFADEEERYLRQEVQRMLYEPQLPNGGSKERRYIERFKKLLEKKDWQDERGRQMAQRAIAEWQKVLPDDPRNPGRYYVRKPLSPRMDKETYKWLDDLRHVAHDCRWWDIKWFAQMMLDGPPEPVSDFEMECLFVLRKSDGTVDRLVRLRNILGEVSKGPHHQGSDILDPVSFAAPEKYRTWCLAHGNFSWKGNQTDLHKLHEDNSHSNAWRVINQIDSVGSLRVGKYVLWFCDECVYVTPFVSGAAMSEPPAGPFTKAQCLRPDSEGVYWFDGEGYYLNRKGRESEFRQGRPKMLPDLKLQDMFPGDKRDEREVLAEFYREISHKLRDTVGDHQSSLALASICAYSAAPEIFADHGLFPGLFIHGESQSGKTKFTEWLMYLRGFHKNAGMGLLKATAVGLLIESENYSSEPLWADEYRYGFVKPEIEAVLRDSYNRQPPVKYSPDGVQREMKTTFVVSGESTSSDGAMRSRFPHVQISSKRRIANHLVWMESNKEKFFLITRFIHENRAEFVSFLKYYLGLWLRSPALVLVNERERMVHGISYAAWMTLCRMLPGCHDFEEVEAFKNFMYGHAQGSSADVSSETNSMVFIIELLNAVKAEAVPPSCFRMEVTLLPHAPGRPNQPRWASIVLYLDPDPTMSFMRAHLTKQRSDLPLRRKDLRDQLSKLPFWVEPEKGKKLNKRFGPGAAVTRAWGFALDRMGELGYTACSDEEYQAYMMGSQDGEGDPRKGAFYYIIDMLEAHERKMQEAAR